MISMLERKDIISEYEQSGSIRAVARKLHINRKTVKNYVSEYLEAVKGGDETLVSYLKSEPSYKTPVRAKRVLTEEVCSMIDTLLRDNARKRQQGDRKLCMKASDIHAAIIHAGFKISYPTVCNYIRTTLGGNAEELPECYIRQVYSPGQDCEFDWGEMYLTIDGRRTKLYMAVFTLAYSNYRAAYLYLRQDTQAFLESHRQFFHDIGHVPHRMVYDNMRVAVASFVGGKQPTDALLRMEAVYGFTHRFCNARSGNEKGHVERSVEVVRRKAFCEADTFNEIREAECQVVYACSELNSPLLVMEGSPEAKSQLEFRHMLPLKKEIGCFEQQTYTVDKYSTIVVKGIHYSVPDHLVEKKVNVFIYCNKLKIFCNRELVAEQERTPVNGWKLDLMHYVRTLKKKPGALAGSAALSMHGDLKKLFDTHFADSPSDFIIVLQKAKDKDFSADDIVAYGKKIRSLSMQPSLDSFRQVMFGEADNEKTVPDVTLATASSADIEEYAASGISKITGIMNSNIACPHAATT